MKMTKQDLIELANKCNGCIVTRYADDNYPLGKFHSNNIWLDEETELLTLPIEVDCIYQVMSETEYNNSVLADSIEKANFEDWFGCVDSVMLIIGIK